MIVAPQQKRFTADAKAAMHMRDLTFKAIAEHLQVHPNSVRAAINFGQNRNVLLDVCKLLELNAPTE